MDLVTREFSKLVTNLLNLKWIFTVQLYCVLDDTHYSHTSMLHFYLIYIATLAIFKNL